MSDYDENDDVSGSSTPSPEATDLLAAMLVSATQQLASTSSAAPPVGEVAEGRSSASAAKPKVSCVACRSLKMRCLRPDPDSASCERCLKMNRECVVPPYRKPGRVKGAKNKYKGVDRALRQIQYELKKAQKAPVTSQDDVMKRLVGSTADDSELIATLLAAQVARGTPAPPNIPTDWFPTAPAASTSSNFSQSTRQQQLDLLPPTSSSLTLPPAQQHQQLSDVFLKRALERNTAKRPHSELDPLPRPAPPPPPRPTLAPPLPPNHQQQQQQQQPHQDFATLSNLGFSPNLHSPNFPSSASHTSSVEGGHNQPSQSLSNPLGLLAEASEAVRPSDSKLPATSPSNHDYHSSRMTNTHSLFVQSSSEPDSLSTNMTDMLSSGPLDTRLHALNLPSAVVREGLLAITSPDRITSEEANKDLNFFQPNTRGECRRGDLGPECDPLDLAILTEQEADTFFAVFYEHLHPLVAVLDPTLHTAKFVRSRSAFLFSAICFHGAQFTPDAAGPTKRLRIHCERLAKLIVVQEHKSLEIAQAFLVWLPWLPPPDRLHQDPNWSYISFVLGFTSELGLEKPISRDWPSEKICAALGPDLDGLNSSDFVLLQRLIRNRERFWIRFFLWESASAVAFGRNSSVFVENDLIKNEEWWLHPLALPHDRETSAICRLRRYLISLSNEIKMRIQMNPSEGTDWISDHIDASLHPWRQKWLQFEAIESESAVPSLYVDLLWQAGRLWCLSVGLQHRPSSPPDMYTPAPKIVNDCLQAGLQVCATAITGLQSSRFYWKIPNTVFPLISWAACLSMRLFDCDVGFEGFFTSQSHLLGLLGNLALLLEQVGSTPSHRRGTAAVYGRHLQVIVRSRVMSVWKLHSDAADLAAGGEIPEPLTIVPGTVIPLTLTGEQEQRGGGSIPLAGWPNEWWWAQDRETPWMEDMSQMMGLLGGVEDLYTFP